jgi:hypothetical protein
VSTAHPSRDAPLLEKSSSSMAKRALLIGIEEYENNQFPALKGCADDARRMAEALRYDYQGEINFDCRVLTAPGSQRITRVLLRKTWIDLFDDFNGDILFYFSGHGMPLNTSGYLITQDGSYYDPGLTMNELFTLANMAKARSVLFILDCCHAGMAGNLASPQGGIERADIREGVTLIAAASSKQQALMENGRSLFTDRVIGALQGGACNLEGYVTAPSIYSYVESTFGAHGQRPIFKSFARQLEPVARCKPHVDTQTLRDILQLFPDPDYEFPVDPSYETYRLKEPQPRYDMTDEVVVSDGDRMKGQIREKIKICSNAGLLRPSKFPHLFWAMLYSATIVLTPLGKHYWYRFRRG